MVLWSAWFLDVLPHVPGCPNALVEHELRRTAQEFFRRTRAWKQSFSYMPVAANTVEVMVKPADPTLDLVRVEAVYFDDRMLTPLTYDTLSGWYGDTWENHTASSPDSFYSLEPAKVRLYPIPFASATKGLKVMASVTPSDTSTGLPDDIALKYRDVLHVGAKSRLMLYPNRAWTNMDLAVAYGQNFTAQADKFAADQARSFTNARIPARPKWC